MKNKILFDMDWTLYSFDNWKYKWSKLEKQVEKNAFNLLQILSKKNDCIKIFNQIKKDYWESFSIAFEKIFWLEKQKYFENVWDINPKWLIDNNRNVVDVFSYLKWLWFELYIVSESPLIWINRVLTFLQVNNLLSWIYSWQWNERKSNWLLYNKVVNEIWTWYFMIWDQIDSDVIMSKKSWFKPIYISDKWEKSDQAEFNIENLSGLCNIIK